MKIKPRCCVCKKLVEVFDVVTSQESPHDSKAFATCHGETEEVSLDLFRKALSSRSYADFFSSIVNFEAFRPKDKT